MELQLTLELLAQTGAKTVATFFPSSVLRKLIERNLFATSEQPYHLWLEYFVFEQSLLTDVIRRIRTPDGASSDEFSSTVNLHAAQRWAGFKHVRLIVAQSIRDELPYEGTAYDLTFDSKDELRSLNWQRRDFRIPLDTRTRQYRWIGVAQKNEAHEIALEATALMDVFRQGKGYNVFYKSCEDYAMLLGCRIMATHGWNILCGYKMPVETAQFFLALERVLAHCTRRNQLGYGRTLHIRRCTIFGIRIRPRPRSVVFVDQNCRLEAWLEDEYHDSLSETEI